MAKYELRLKAREMRTKGKSVRDISKRLNVSKNTASIWTRDIILSVNQLENLRKSMLKGGELGRVKGALVQKKRRLAMIKKCDEEGVELISQLSDREFLMSGLALYWAEGSKKDGRLTFCNSNPELIKFMIKWLKKNFGINKKRLKVRVQINKVHKNREKIVKKYWSAVTGIPLSQFNKTSFKKTPLHKIFKNHNEHFGTLDVMVLRPSELYYKILGLIKGLSNNANVAQW